MEDTEIIDKIIDMKKQIKEGTLTAGEFEGNGVEMNCSICDKIIGITDKYYITFEGDNVGESLCKYCGDKLKAPAITF